MTTPRLPPLLEEAEAIRAGAEARAANLVGASVAGIGWATVELERAARELDPAGTWTVAPRDALLGASCWRHVDDARGTGAPALLLLEPDTEGPLAAALVRFGEGVAAIYVRPTGATDVPEPTASANSVPRLGVAGACPLGRGRLLLGGPAWGPHVIVLDERDGP